MSNRLRIRVQGDGSLPTLVYLPGMHGDWTQASRFRAAVLRRARLAEVAYARTTSWSLDDFAAAIEEALLSKGIDRGWLMGESFGSQPAWAIIKRARERGGAQLLSAGDTPARQAQVAPESSTGFLPLGLILVSGFVRHPLNWGVRLLGWVARGLPMWCVKLVFGAYSCYAHIRYWRAPETLASIAEFVANRTIPADRRAVAHRYSLIAESDLRPVAREAVVPVFYLAGPMDPLVPWCYVRWWLGRNCPGYRGGKTIWHANHDVLGSAPQKAAEQIFGWIADGSGSQPAAELIGGAVRADS
jgi:pimeloyl-ACP methyl ester carboxylesterase